MNKCIMMAIAAVALASPSFAQTTSGNYNDTYGVLGERNMFMRERHRPRPPREPRTYTRPDTTSPEAVERMLTLRGVAIEDDELHAYLENTRTGQLIRIAPGDALAKGHVAEIAIDAISYEVEGRTVWIEIGQNLSGARTAAAERSSVGALQPMPDATGSTTAPSAPSPSGSSLEERMKQRRLQQRGAK